MPIQRKIYVAFLQNQYKQAREMASRANNMVCVFPIFCIQLRISMLWLIFACASAFEFFFVLSACPYAFVWEIEQKAVILVVCD